MTPDEFAALALILPNVTESVHFGNRDFRVDGRIFATLASPTTANLYFTSHQQFIMMELHPGLFRPLPNAWGARGWTSLDITRVERNIALSAIATARENVIAKKPPWKI